MNTRVSPSGHQALIEAKLSEVKKTEARLAADELGQLLAAQLKPLRGHTGDPVFRAIEKAWSDVSAVTASLGRAELARLVTPVLNAFDREVIAIENGDMMNIHKLNMKEAKR